ncbi:hypothetical protein Bbelb_165840 [Branchiostoma belcheri]|nr:hypothetical protein Bbelb_165840 [Branchiostoma belcheri]
MILQIKFRYEARADIRPLAEQVPDSLRGHGKTLSDTVIRESQDWVALNRARAKVARTGDNLARWGKSTSTTCSCGEDPQTIQHLMHGCRLGPTCTDTDLQEANEAARNWLEWIGDKL